MAVFYSFYYKRDAWRVQQIAKMGAVKGQPILNSQEWEAVKRQGKQAIENWIAKQMNYKEAVVVLAGTETGDRRWVKYEIEKAWDDRRPLVGINIHGLADRSGRTDRPGPNPFSRIAVPNGGTLADRIRLHSPIGRDSQAVYANIEANLKTWVQNAYRRP